MPGHLKPSLLTQGGWCKSGGSNVMLTDHMRNIWFLSTPSPVLFVENQIGISTSHFHWLLNHWWVRLLTAMKALQEFIIRRGVPMPYGCNILSTSSQPLIKQSYFRHGNLVALINGGDVKGPTTNTLWSTFYAIITPAMPQQISCCGTK